MNFYVTSGTPDYMEKLIEKNAQHPLILLHGNGNSVVLHESDKKSIFAVPRKFEVIGQKGQAILRFTICLLCQTSAPFSRKKH